MKVSLTSVTGGCYVNAKEPGFDSSWRVTCAADAAADSRALAQEERERAARILRSAERMETAARIIDAQNSPPVPRRTITMCRYDGRISLDHRGKTISTRTGQGCASYAIALDAGEDVRAALRERARAAGFTHIRYSGDWGEAGAPRAGAL